MAMVKITPDMVAAALRKTDWRALEAKTDKEIEAAVAADPDAAPIMSAEAITAARIAATRKRLGLSQPAFARRYAIPLGTLRDWEQGKALPEAPARAYLRVIEREPEAAARALAMEPSTAD